MAEAKDSIDYAGETGRERPGEHWNARIIREQAERQVGRSGSVEGLSAPGPLAYAAARQALRMARLQEGDFPVGPIVEAIWEAAERAGYERARAELAARLEAAELVCALVGITGGRDGQRGKALTQAWMHWSHDYGHGSITDELVAELAGKRDRIREATLLRLRAEYPGPVPRVPATSGPDHPAQSCDCFAPLTGESPEVGRG